MLTETTRTTHQPESPLRAEPDAPAPIAPAIPPYSAKVLQLLATFLSHERFADAATAFATEMAAVLQFDRVAIGIRERGDARVLALSHAADFRPQSHSFDAIGAAMDEALDQGCTLAYPPNAGDRPLVTLAHAEVARSVASAVCTVPLANRSRAFGALLVVRSRSLKSAAIRPDEIALCEHVAAILAPVIELKHQAERPWHRRLRQGLRALVQRLVFEPGHGWEKAIAGVAVLVLAGLLFVPVERNVGAPARIEGAIQRAVVAPADGFLRQAYVRSGDAVKTGQVLADLAEEELQLEARKWESELAQHENAASAAFARGDRAQSVINQAKADEAQAQLDLVSHQIARGRIVAPFDGVVIQGDLSQSLGAPVQRGDVLLTVAPAQQYRLIVEVDERDIAAIKGGQSGRVALGALVGQHAAQLDALPFTVTRVTPVANARDGRNFFEVEGKLGDASASVRPGLQGVAKISVGREPLAWIWTHRFTEWLRLTLWSWGL